jgi:aldehyde dehydrogenase (NAD+)
MKSAAEQLTPLTLELGGKSPAIVDQTADLALAAKRIAWGKFINAGQTCVSPDYVYVHQSKRKQFCKHIRQHLRSFYGDNPIESPDYARIVNASHFNRLEKLLDPQKVFIGGRTDAEQLYIEPTVLTDIDWNHKIMQGEIFGPLLPVLTFDDIEEVIRSVRSRHKPLSLYLFTSDSEQEQRITNEIQFGGGCINDTVAHLGNLDLPFGGIGHSGFGNYHGRAGFEELSHPKSIMKKATWLDIPLRYPPYKNNLKWLKKLTDFL